MAEILSYSRFSHRRLWLVRGALLVAILLAAAVVWWRWGRDISRWAQLVRVHHELRTHAPATTQPVLAADASDTLETYRTAYMRYLTRPTIWERKLRTWGTTDPVDSGMSIVAFCGERTSAAGNRRLVLIQLGAIYQSTDLRVKADVRLFQTGSLLAPKLDNIKVKVSPDYYPSGEIPNYPGMQVLLMRIPWGKGLGVQEGSPDAVDSSRFSIPYNVGGKEGRIVGQLKDDDSVSLRLEDGSPLPVNPAP